MATPSQCKRFTEQTRRAGRGDEGGSCRKAAEERRDRPRFAKHGVSGMNEEKKISRPQTNRLDQVGRLGGEMNRLHTSQKTTLDDTSIYEFSRPGRQPNQSVLPLTFPPTNLPAAQTLRKIVNICIYILLSQKCSANTQFSGAGSDAALVP